MAHHPLMPDDAELAAEIDRRWRIVEAELRRAAAELGQAAGNPRGQQLASAAAAALQHLQRRNGHE
jgi:hypothetical protein